MHKFAFLRRGLLNALLTMSILGAVTMLGACNTTAGIGQDVSATGKAVTNSAEKVKQGL
ncbi:MAG TPA: entericidin A/B family lipoprotein [Acetobacteraceae bacterium]|jgi:entericidin B|nr:entericidin A/B family lipoprotein [Acetobacteraceae bacterium]